MSSSPEPKSSHLEQIVEYLHDMIYELDHNGCFIYCNHALEKFSGYSKAELSRKPYWELVQENAKEALIAFYRKQRKSRTHDTYYEFPMISRSGRKIWIGQNVRMFFDEEDRMNRVIAVARDLTKLKETCSALEESNRRVDEEQKRYQAVVEQQDSLISRFRPDGTFTFVNKAYARYFNSNKTALIGTSLFDLIPRDQHAALRKHLKDFSIERSTKVYCQSTRMPDGSIEYYEWSEQALFGGAGEIVEFQAVGRNITQQKEAENKLRLSEEKFRAISDASPLGIYVTDQHGRCEYTNRECQKIIGQSMEEALGEGWVNSIPPEDRDEVLRKWKKALSTKDRYSHEHRFRHSEGSTIWAHVRASPMYHQNDLIGYVGTVEDITERKLHQQELLEAKETAEAASKAKNDFLSTMSHEIRTPLNAVVGATHLLLDEDTLPHQTQNLHTLKASSENLLGLINDILDYNKIEAGKILFEEVEINLEELIISIRQTMLIKAEEKGIQLKVIYDDDIPETIIGDPVRLNQIVSNLAINAIKFTDRGFVKIEAVLTSEDEAFASIDFSVEDTGIGISKEKQKVIFDSFSQAEKETARMYGGTGLGLAIAKRLLKLLGSDIFVESEAGKGSRFYFSMKFRKGSSHSSGSRSGLSAKEIKADLSGLKILLVEDNNVNQMVAKSFLFKWGATTEIAVNGRDAIAQLKKKTYDLVLMDIQMPEMDGYAATVRVRELEGPNQQVPILALTASAQAETKKEIEKAGANDFVAKPFNPQELLTKIALWTGRSVELPPESKTSNAGLERLIEFSKVRQMTNYDHHFYKKILDSFVQELISFRKEYIQAIEEKDMTALNAIKHKILPSLQLFNAKVLKQEVSKELKANKAGEIKQSEVADTILNINRMSDTLLDILHKELKSCEALSKA